MPHRHPPAQLATALFLAAFKGVPMLPLSRDKRPFANCADCTGNVCGGRPNMKTPGPCTCPYPCHAWAAATTDTAVLTSAAWADAWRQAGDVAYHPGGAGQSGVTVVDLDNPAAVTWARQALPATRVVASTRGEHWIYLGAMASANKVRPGVDIKSRMAYARWLGHGTGTMTPLPDNVRALVVKAQSPVRPVAHTVAMPAAAGGGECRHRTPVYLERGIAMAVQRIEAASEAIHTTVYRTFLAVLSRHGRCGCLTDAHVKRLFTAAHAKGESDRHCTVAWANARTALGM
ncbi:bifunctional DNA primase/polymerase [Streptomyces sp. NPDC002073]